MKAPATFDGVYLICDGCRVEHVHHRERGTQDALKEAVDKKAVAAGWKLSRTHALCPSCAKRSVN
jgi:hypothetical protein